MRGAIEAYVLTILAIVGASIVVWRSHLRPLSRQADRAQRGEERSRLKLGVASISATVLALLLIAFVGLAQLGFEIWKFNSIEHSSAPPPSLEAFSRHEIADAETLQRQHRELVDAIRSLTPRASTPAQVNDAAIPAAFEKLQARIEKLESATEQSFSGLTVLGYFGWVVVACLGFGGLALVMRAIFREAGATRKSIELLSGCILMLLSVAGGSKLKFDFKTDLTLLKDLHISSGDFKLGGFKLWEYKAGDVKFELPGGGAPKPTPSPDARQGVDVYLHVDVARPDDALPAKMDCGPKNDRRVGPFDDGAVTLNSDDGRNSLDAIIKDLKQQLAPAPANVKPDRLTAIILIGSADKRSLKPKTVALYSSNAGLAQARVGVVKEALDKVFEPNSPPIIESYAGPVQTSAAAAQADLAGDRSVQVCMLWDRKR